MNLAKRKEKLNENLRIANALHRLSQSDEYRSVLLPYLQEATKVQWLDPSTCKDKDDFFIQYQYLRARAQVYGELIKFLDNQEGIISKTNLDLQKADVSYEL